MIKNKKFYRDRELVRLRNRLEELRHNVRWRVEDLFNTCLNTIDQGQDANRVYVLRTADILKKTKELLMKIEQI